LRQRRAEPGEARGRELVDSLRVPVLSGGRGASRRISECLTSLVGEVEPRSRRHLDWRRRRLPPAWRGCLQLGEVASSLARVLAMWVRGSQPASTRGSRPTTRRSTPPTPLPEATPPERRLKAVHGQPRPKPRTLNSPCPRWSCYLRLPNPRIRSFRCQKSSAFSTKETRSTKSFLEGYCALLHE